MEKIFQIAIDGPSGAGKSTVAKIIASKLDIDYIDTGAMYRACGLKMVRLGIPMVEDETLKKMLDSTDIDIDHGKIMLDGEDVSGLIRTQEISKAASDCSAFKTVRVKMVELQQAMGSRKSVIMDGRDICKVVLPNAEFKYFITATPEERAKRRFLELQEKGNSSSYEQILKEVNERDYNDSHREVDPLECQPDAELLDTTNMSIDEVVNHIINKIK